MVRVQQKGPSPSPCGLTVKGQGDLSGDFAVVDGLKAVLPGCGAGGDEAESESQGGEKSE